MDADDPHHDAIARPLVPPPNTSCTQLGMGLPYELWDHTIGFLELEPYPLLACCLTCRSFRTHAQRRLWDLHYPQLALDNYTDIDRFVDEIRTIPGRAQAVRWFGLSRSPSLVFALIPYRLASQLKNVKTLNFSQISKIPVVPSSTWSLYGRAFPNVVSLHFAVVQFPSFMEFVRIITSFRALQNLDLYAISCARMGTPPQTLYKPRPLRRLLLGHGVNDGNFLHSFVPWFSSRGRVQDLVIGASLLLHFLEVLRGIHMHLPALDVRFDSVGELRPMKAFQRSWRSFLSLLSEGFPHLREVTLGDISSCDIPFAGALISHAVKPTLTFTVEVDSPDSNPDPEAWRLYDTVLFAVHFTSRARVEVDATNIGRDLLVYFPLMSIVWSVA